MIADEIYQDVAFDGPIAPIGALDPEAPVISLSGLSKGYLVPGWRTGWLAVGGGDRLKDVLGRHHEARRRPAVLDDADAARDCRGARGRPLASTGVSHGAAGARRSRLHARERDPGISSTRPSARSTQCRKSSCRPERPTPISSSTSSMPPACCAFTARDSGWIPADGYFRMVTLAPPAQLNEIWDLIAGFVLLNTSRALSPQLSALSAARCCICRRARLHLAARRRPDPRHPVGSRRLAVERVDSRVGCRPPAAVSHWRLRRDPEFLEREHLLSRAADACVLRASVCAGCSDSSGLRTDRQRHPLL